MYKYEYIPKEAYGMNTAMYTIALEGWRRGLKLKFENRIYKERKKLRYTLSNGDREHRFQLSIGDKTPRTTTRYTRDKQWTKEKLLENNVPTPNGLYFTKEHGVEEIINESMKLEWPLVVKPADSSLGVGVTTNINDEESLLKAIKKVKHNLGYDNLIVERFINGEDVRVVIVGDKVVNAHKREPFSVVGDGKKTIQSLVNEANNKRNNHPHLYKYKIKINNSIKKYLKDQGYTTKSILKKEERVYLTDSSLLKDGAEIVSLTDIISNNSKEIAVKAMQAMPGMVFAGVDLMIDKATDEAYVLEINSRPNLAGSLYPYNGTGDDVASAIIDLYFPETIKHRVTSKIDINKVYFNFSDIVKSLETGLISEVSIESIPNNIESKKIVLNGKVDSQFLKKWIYRTAQGLRLNSDIAEVNNKEVSIVLSGESEKIERFIEKLKNRTFKNIKIESIQIENWDEIVVFGLNYNNVTNKNDSKHDSTNELKKENMELKSENKKLINRLKRMENSQSWKLTKPFRQIRKKF